MLIFYEQAFRAGANGQPIDWLRQEHLADWKGLASALDRLTPEQRCDAVYADWLLQLHSPAHQALLQIRNLLIGQGALAANYLAELAQNADDAATEEGAEVRIVLDGDWLFVANNGRKISSLNLLGLSRFFVHAADQIRELSAETIGRFGIGFKSSYRIASEVLISSWERNDAFSFRLPICREADLATHPNQERLSHLRTRLAAVGVANLDNAFREVNSLGYCTPEFVSALPPQLNTRTASLRQSKQGTLFCFHLRPDRLGEVQKRITGQIHEIYELCPLFLPKVRVVQLGPNALKMRVGQSDQANNLSNLVEADKITLTTSVPNQRDSHSRFWRLREPGESPVWQVALHTDSQHKLRLDREDDERGVSLKDGAAYAFFPLNAVSWPFRFHLHLKLPTNLARDNWNSADATEVENQLRRAIQCMADWLDTHFELLTGSGWSFEKLVEQRPSPMRNEGDWAARWANVVFEELRVAAANKPLLKTFGGRRVPATAARRVAVVERQAAAEAWSKLSSNPDLGNAFPVFVSEAAEVFDVEAAIPEEVGDAFASILANPQFASEIRQAAMIAYLSTTRHSGRSLERALKSAVVELADHSIAFASDLMTEPCGAELEPAWHECFKRLADWAKETDCNWQSNHVFGERIDQQFRKLAESVFNPTWQQIPIRLATQDDWKRNGEQFWKGSRRPCPAGIRASVMAALRVPTGDGQWLSASDLWLDDDSPVDCFAGLLKSWPLRYADDQRKRIIERMRVWGLLEEWEKSVKKTLEEKLPGELTGQLTAQADGDALSIVLGQNFESSKKLLDGGWAYIISEAEKTAVSRFLSARSKEEALSGKSVLSANIKQSIRSAVCLVAEFKSAPPWLTDSAYQRICRLGLQEQLGLPFLSDAALEKQSEDIGQKVLDGYHRWKSAEQTDEILQGLEELFAKVPINRRRDLFVALSTQKRRRVREFFAVIAAQTTELSLGEKLMAERLQRSEKHVEPLPSPLDRVAALGEAAVHFGKLRCDHETTNAITLLPEQIQPTCDQDATVKALVDQNELQLFGAPQGLRMKWFSGEDLVAELKDADVGWFIDRLIFGHYAKPASEQQYSDMLSLYRLSDVVSDDFRRADARGTSSFDLYQKFREPIVKVLVKKHVNEVGYKAEHILRELLQNSESAYGSKSERVNIPWFEFSVSSGARPTERVIRVRHAGRTFNEIDRDGKPRPDIERIIKINAPNQNTEFELGRFNRGFKSVFTVAKDGRVEVRSGRYGFEILDLLLLMPPEPREDKPYQAETEFEFAASKDDALKMLGFSGVPTGRTPPDLLNATSFLFLTQLRRISLQWEEKSWDWRIEWKALGSEWVEVAVMEKTSSKKEVFWVCSGRLVDNRRFGVAVRVGEKGQPKVLEKEWHNLRLTFETEYVFGLDVLVNGDFEADQGRVNLRSITSSGADIIEAALDAALNKAASQLSETFSAATWVAWAKALHLKDAHEVFSDCFSDTPKRFDRWVERLEERFFENVPCSTGEFPLDQAVFPTRLMRRLIKDYGGRWGLNAADWIEHDAEEELPSRIREREAKFSLHKWISELPSEARLIHSLNHDFQQAGFQALKRSLGKPERDELAEAERIIQEKLRPTITQPAPEVVLEPIEPWTVNKLWHWWHQLGKPLNDYILEGDENWRLFYPDDPGNEQLRRDKLTKDLRAAGSDSGKWIWYRLFSLACLMSAGRRMTELRRFWHQELEQRQFWKVTSGTAFGKGTDSLFEDIVRQPFVNLNATGESAYYWRRVFYDVRKIHKLVWEDDFASTLLELIQSGRGEGVINFLKTGAVPGQNGWVGVFGQSAGAPLFFLIRELCRLGVISDVRVQPLAFFVSTPTRRAMERIGWLPPGSSERMDFESMATISQQLHAKIKGDSQFGPKLLPYHDIPLLHLGLNS